MKSNGTIHFAKTAHRSAKELGLEEDSGNGYYSYSYTETPYTGDTSTDRARQNIYKAIRAKWYANYTVFSSCGSIEIFPNDERNGGIIRVQHIYHHGD